MVTANAVMSCPATGSDTPRLSARYGSSPGTISVPVPMTKLPKASAARLHFMVTVLLESQMGARHSLAAPFFARVPVTLEAFAQDRRQPEFGGAVAALDGDRRNAGTKGFPCVPMVRTV